MTQQSKASNPLRAIMDIRREELPLALLMFTYFFSVITAFWILKPIKKDVLVSAYPQSAPLELFGWTFIGPEAELFAKLLNMVVAAVAVVVFSWLSRRFSRHRLTLIFCAAFTAGFVVYWQLVDRGWAAVGWSFYLYGDLWSTIMVATFFAFLNDSLKPEAARRLYGLIVLGGVAGGAFGTTFLRVWIDDFSYGFWMLVCIGVTGVIAASAFGAGVLVDRGTIAGTVDEAAASAPEKNETELADGNPALAGARLVFRSRYLLAIVAIVGLYEIVSTILDFQFTSTVFHFVPKEERGEQFALVYNISNVAALVVQLFFTSFLMSRFKMAVPLLITPIAILTGSVAFLALPLLWPGSLLNTWDSALNYSVNQSAREALYTPTTREEKYQAKAFIDMFLQRFAKGLAVVVSLTMTALIDDFSAIRWLSIVTIALVAVWVVAARYAGKHFHELSDETERGGRG